MSSSPPANKNFSKSPKSRPKIPSSLCLQLCLIRTYASLRLSPIPINPAYSWRSLASTNPLLFLSYYPKSFSTPVLEAYLLLNALLAYLTFSRSILPWRFPSPDLSSLYRPGWNKSLPSTTGSMVFYLPLYLSLAAFYSLWRAWKVKAAVFFCVSPVKTLSVHLASSRAGSAFLAIATTPPLHFLPLDL